MKTLLVLAQHPELAEALREKVEPGVYRVLHRTTYEEAEPLVAHGLADVCILDLETSSVEGLWMLEKLRRLAPRCPTVVYTSVKELDWEEEAYTKGASHVLLKPVRVPILTAVLEKLRSVPAARSPDTAFVSQTFESPRAHADQGQGSASIAQTLSVLRNLSGILTHSLHSDAMLRQFLLLLREILCVNRAAIFLRQPLAAVCNTPEGSRRLRAVCSVGIQSGLLEHFELSFDAGIGSHLFRFGRILRRESDAARSDPEAGKEFELLGAEVAVPILDRETVVGVALFDGRITGEPLASSELQLVFHLLEQLGLAVKNIWLHEQLSANHEMMAGIMRELSSACLVISRELSILHANRMARRHFPGADKRGGEMEFTDLPQAIGAKAYQVLKTGAALSNFRFEPENSPGTVYNISIVPFQRLPDGLPASVLLIAEDLTQAEQLRRLEMEAANVRLVETMADRLTNEIGNALVPLSVHQQLLAEKLSGSKVDPEFLTMLQRDLAESLRRIGRSNSQMKFLARHGLLTQDSFPLLPVLEDAYEEASKFQPAKAAQVVFEGGDKPLLVSGDRAALKHAFTELMINGLQANPSQPKLQVRLRYEPAHNGNRQGGLQVEIQDNGPGFTPETASKAAEPFFKTRVVGLGLGLTVTRKIVELHQGKLEIVVPGADRRGCVRVSLPAMAGSNKETTVRA